MIAVEFLIPYASNILAEPTNVDCEILTATFNDSTRTVANKSLIRFMSSESVIIYPKKLNKKI